MFPEETMQLDRLDDLLEDQILDLYSAETQILKALPRMSKIAASEALRDALERHMKETEEHVTRLERIGVLLDLKLRGKKCLGMEGLIKESKEVLESDGDESVIDAAIIGAARRVEHYEAAAYATALALARRLGEEEVVDLLSANLAEERRADETLNRIAEEEVNPGALEGADESESEEGEEEAPPGGGKEFRPEG